MFNPLLAIPFFVGGLIISLALSLNNFISKTGNENNSNSLYSMLTLDSQSKWRSSFVAGLMFTSCFTAAFFGFEEIGVTTIKPFESERLFFQGTGMLYFIISGFLIGLGTRLARESLTKYSFIGLPSIYGKSAVTTVTIIAFAAVTATLRSSFTILQGFNLTKLFNEHLDFRLSFVIPLIILGVNIARNLQNKPALKEIANAFIVGALLSAGIMVAGLTRRHQVLDGFSFNSSWNPFLLFTILGAIVGNLLFTNSFKITEPVVTPVYGGAQGKAGLKTLIGCALFGIGFGITGLSPASGLVVSPIYLPQVVFFFLPFVVAGQMAGSVLDRTAGSVKGLKTM